MRTTSPFLPVLLASAILFAAGGECRLAAQQEQPVVVYLVRHAERAEDGTSDPPISADGEARARLLAVMLRDAGLTHIYTTDYLRTRSTASPVAQATGLRPTLYEARDLAGLAARLTSTLGRHFVVGHSDTTPALVSELGGDPGSAIADPEYDRLYVVTLAGTGASTVLLRFGEPYPR